MITDRCLRYLITLFVSPFLISGLLLHPAIITFSHAASTITSDGTMGTTINQAGNIYNINGGTIKGTNQFHSFGLFSVWTGDTASFNGPSWIANIIGRITGGQQSIIDGTLRSTITRANLYLLNPYGVLFGPNASLDVSGSFHVSTADYLRMTDGAKFYADLGKQSTLSTAPVAAFGFLSNTPAPISIQESYLEVPEGKTLSIIGGDINITGGPTGWLLAPSGRINIASVASPGEVIPVESRIAPDLQMSSFDRLGNINLSNLAYLDVSSISGSGTVVIRGGKLLIENSSIVADTLGDIDGAKKGIDIGIKEDLVANGTLIEASTSGIGQGGDIVINSGSMVMWNSKIESSTNGAGNSGNVEVYTGSLGMGGGSQINTHNDWAISGNAGNLTVTADSIFMTGAYDDPSGDQTRLSTRTMGSGRGGDLRVTTGSLEIRDGAKIETTVDGSGAGGNIDINAESILVSGENALGSTTGIHALTWGSGNAGRIRIDTGNLEVRSGEIDTSSYMWGFSPGRAGDLEVTADRILLTGWLAGIHATGNDGGAGNIQIRAGRLEVTDGASILSTTGGSGTAGNIEVTANSILLSGSYVNLFYSAISSEALFGDSTGAAGDIRINAQSLEVRDRAQIRAGTQGAGNGGNIEVKAESVLIKDGGGIDAYSSGSGSSGSIDVTAGNVVISGVKDIFAANISADVGESGSGKGGAIRIATNNLEVKDGANISATSYGQGDAGSIIITAKDILLDGGSHFTAYISANARGSGNAGDINIGTNTLEMRGGAQIQAVTTAEGQGGSVRINAADQVILSGIPGGVPGGNQGGNYNTGVLSSAYGSGSAGNIQVTAGNLQINDESYIASGTSGSGNAGNISLTAPWITMTNGGFIEAATYENASGKGGVIQIATNNLEVKDGSYISVTSFGQGDAGSMIVTAKNILLDGGSHFSANISANAQGSGNAGDINIDTNSLEMRGGAQIEAVTLAEGQGGSVRINAADQVILSGVPGGIAGGFPGPNYNTAVISSAYSSGSAGNIQVTAGNLQINDGAYISSGTSGSGKGGNISLTAPWVTMANGGYIDAATDGSGTGGSIQLSGNQIQLFNGASISAKSFGTGNAGNAGDIGINAGDTLRMKNSSITTEAKQADGGNINIKAGHMVELIDSKITTSVGGGPQTVGGNITIDPEYVILNDSQIIAEAYQGKGGNITIIADVFLASPDSIVDASSQLGISGTVNIQAPIQNISGTLAPMEGNFLSAEALLRDRCIARIRGESISSFVVSGRDGLPIRPGSVLPSPIY